MKRILFLGSSVTYGVNGRSFVEMLAESGRYECEKLAVSGTTLVDLDRASYVSRLRDYVPKKPVDLLVVQLSTNDASRALPLGTPENNSDGGFDTSTVCGAVEWIISYGRSTLGCPVAFYTGTKYNSPRYADMVRSLLLIAGEWGVPVLDLWHDDEMNAVSEEDYRRFMADPIHPTEEGYRLWWLRKFEQFLERQTN